VVSRVNQLPLLVATDLDGTLVHSDGTVTDRTRRVLVALEERGVPVVFVTGRPLRWAMELFEYVGEIGLAVVSNGAMVWDVRRDRSALVRPFETGHGLEICRRIRQAVPGTSFALESVHGMALEPAYLERYPVPEGTPRGPIDQLVANPGIRGSVVKILARHEEVIHQDFWDAARDVVGDLAEVTWSLADQSFLEISPRGVTKASTLALLCADLGISARQVVAFGDMPNDLTMLGWAGTAYAVANAHPSVRAIAQPALTNDQDGVAKVLSEIYGLVPDASAERMTDR
jgi:Cof subfamily protein (haloacid dehalogenase superfamily)